MMIMRNSSSQLSPLADMNLTLSSSPVIRATIGKISCPVVGCFQDVFFKIIALVCRAKGILCNWQSHRCSCRFRLKDKTFQFFLEKMQQSSVAHVDGGFMQTLFDGLTGSTGRDHIFWRHFSGIPRGNPIHVLKSLLI